jgi:hypothetical protein
MHPHTPRMSSGLVRLSPLEAAQLAEHLVLRVFTDGAGVVEDDVRLALILRRRVPHPLEDAGDRLAVVDVHLQP